MSTLKERVEEINGKKKTVKDWYKSFDFIRSKHYCNLREKKLITVWTTRSYVQKQATVSGTFNEQSSDCQCTTLRLERLWHASQHFTVLVPFASPSPRMQCWHNLSDGHFCDMY